MDNLINIKYHVLFTNINGYLIYVNEYHVNG